MWYTRMSPDRAYGLFIWDIDKEQENIRRHGLNFIQASQVFRDPDVIIAIDTIHSQSETRMFGIGKINHRIATVRFTYRGEMVRIFGAGYWRKERKLYEEKKKA
jgi:uncharacterized DUF497 family protein